MLSTLASLSAVAAYFGVRGRHRARPQQRRRSSTRAPSVRPVHGEEAIERQSFRDRARSAPAQRLGPLVLALNPRATSRRSARGSSRAGLAAKRLADDVSRAQGRPAFWRGRRRPARCARAPAAPLDDLLVAVGLGLCRVHAPRHLRDHEDARRAQTEIGLELPDALDLLAVSVEAGLGFDAALAKLCEHIEGPLAEELRSCCRRCASARAAQEGAQEPGRPRRAAPSVAAFVRAIIQADQLGMSLGRILRVQANDARN